jgi:hypothetical protein
MMRWLSPECESGVSCRQNAAFVIGCDMEMLRTGTDRSEQTSRADQGSAQLLDPFGWLARLRKHCPIRAPGLGGGLSDG